MLGQSKGVLGPNGAGKSSLLNIIYGADKDFDGEVTPSCPRIHRPIPSYTTCTDPPQVWIREGIDIGYLRQNPSLEAGLTVAETVAQGLRAKVVKQT